MQHDPRHLLKIKLSSVSLLSYVTLAHSNLYESLILIAASEVKNRGTVLPSMMLGQAFKAEVILPDVQIRKLLSVIMSLFYGTFIF